MRRVLGPVLSLLAAAALATEPAPIPAPTPEDVARALNDLSAGRPATLPGGVTLSAAVAQVAPIAGSTTPLPPGIAPQPDVAPPAPVPVQKSEAPARIRINPQAQAYTTLISEPPVIEDESAVTAETLEWRDWLEAKKDRRIERNDEIGGLAAVGIRLGSKAQSSSIEGLTEEQAASLAAWNDDGAMVVSVVEGSPAELAGLAPGDVIVQFAGVWVDSTSFFVRLASRAAVGVEQPIRILRDGQVETLYVTPMDRRELGK